VRDKALDGELLAKVIVEKLQSSSCSVSFADIAKQAIDNGKPALAALVRYVLACMAWLAT